MLLRVALRQREEQRACLYFAVSDSGVGIDQHGRERLFQPFSQADESITRRFGGTGLGLAISRELLQMMGGHFGVDSAPGRGTTFDFSVWLALAADVPGTQPDTAASQAGALSSQLAEHGRALGEARILVAEDNLVNQMVASQILKRAGLAFVIAGNGQEALEAIQQSHFDAILMDVHMPVMDGLEATARIRRHSAIPIIALSAGITQEEREQCLAAGMNDFLPKPINPKDLMACLSHWIA